MITSIANPTIKRLHALHERRGRAEQGHFLIEGARLVEEALDAGVVPQMVLVAPDVLQATARGRALHARLLHERGLNDPLEVTPAVLRHVAATETPPGVLATVPLPHEHDLGALPDRAGLALVLDGLQDPGNAGAILRSAAAADVDTVVALQGCVDLYAPKVVRAGMGAHFRLALATGVPIAAVARWLNARGQALLADAHADEAIYDVDLRAPTVVVVGGEAGGAAHAGALPELRRVAIPMPGPVESLNAAVAAAVILFEALRQRRPPR